MTRSERIEEAARDLSEFFRNYDPFWCNTRDYAQEPALWESAVGIVLRTARDDEPEPEGAVERAREALADAARSLHLCYERGDPLDTVALALRGMSGAAWRLLAAEAEERGEETSVAEKRTEVFARPECVFNYCPHPELCQEKCQSAAEERGEVDDG